jgi:NAD(P)-dependent dehydrogenase (short-subunit alcohol dehydrogenase family)
MGKKAALVTGAARRIGRAIAERLAGAGYDLAIHCSEATRLEAEAVAANLRSQGRQAVVIAAELGDASQPARVVSEANAALGPLTVLVNNASIFARDAPDAIDVALFDKLVAVNLRAPVLLAQHFVQQVPNETEAAIVNLVDQRVWRPTPQFFSYSITKSALWWTTQTMAQAFAPRRIRVNAIGPGPVLPNTPQGNAGFEKEVAGVLLRRAVDSHDIADAVLYLVEARNVTGQMIAVDAGQHLAWETPDIPEGRV